MAKTLIDRIAERIKEIRKERGITQEELAFRSGLHKNYISDAECGRRNFTAKGIEKISKGLEVDPIELLKRTEQ